MISPSEKAPADGGKHAPVAASEVDRMQIRSTVHVGAVRQEESAVSAPPAALTQEMSFPATEDQDRYQLLLNSIDQAYCVIEMLFDERGQPNDYRFLEINALFEEQTGLVNALGKRIREFVPQHEQHWFDIYGKVALTGEPIRFENAAAAMSRWFRVSAFRDGGPESRKVVVIFSDITARKRAELLESLSQQLAKVSTEADILNVAVDAVGRYLNVDRCYFIECLERENLIVVSRNWVRGGTKSVEGRYDLFDFGGIEWWRSYSGGNLAVEDVELNPLTRHKLDNYRKLGVRSYAVQPFRRDGEWTVVLGVTETVPRKWSAEDLRLLDDVVARVWPLIQQSRIDRELRKNEEFLRSVVDATADCIKVMNLDGRLEWMSENGMRLLELTDFTQVKGRFLSEFYPDEYTRKKADEAVRTARVGGIGRFRGYCPTFAGTPKWWDVIVSPIRSAELKTVQILGVSRDVTNVREVEEALRQSQQALEHHAQTLEARVEELRVAKAESEMAGRSVAESAERFRVLSEVVSLQVWTANPAGELDFANQECVEYLGGELQRDILGLAWKKFVHPEDLPVALEGWRQSVETGRHYEGKFRLRRKDGVDRWFLVRAEPLRNAEGDIIKWFGSNTDIDELKSAQHAAERASRAKDDFLAALSHELRTPLTPVLMTAAALRDDPRLPVEVREQLGMMERNIELEARIIDDLLDLTAVSHGKLQLRAERCDAHALLDLAVEIVREEALARQIAIERSYRAASCWLRADPSRFQQVVWNLLRNAVKFTPPGGRVGIHTRNETTADGTNWLRIEVTDTGIGIDPRNLEKIFRPFEQGNLKGAHRFGGLGLGLAIARAVVDLHGGRISAASAGPGRGATFVVELLTDEGVVNRRIDGAAGDPNRLSNAGAVAESSAGAVVRLRLLLVEDDASSLETLSRLLRRDGHHVIAAASVGDAIAAVESHEFDLVISDIGLPDGSGIELMERLRDNHGLRGVALSGYGMEEDQVRTRNAGFVTHLIKPIQIAELRRVLAALGPASA